MSQFSGSKMSRSAQRIKNISLSTVVLSVYMCCCHACENTATQMLTLCPYVYGISQYVSVNIKLVAERLSWDVV